MIYIKSSKDEDFITINNSSDVVVFAPSFCWFKSLDIPTKKLKKAKKIADHMLNDRPDGYGDIELFKEDDKYQVYCYNKDEIEALVKKYDKIESKIYFAYELTDNLVHLIDEKAFIEFLKSLEITKKPLLKLNPDRDEMLSKTVAINIMLLVSIVLYSFSQYSYISNIEQNIDAITPTDKSSYEIDSLINSYSAKERKSKELRTAMAEVLKNNQNLSLIEYNNGKFSTTKGEEK